MHFITFIQLDFSLSLHVFLLIENLQSHSWNKVVNWANTAHVSWVQGLCSEYQSWQINHRFLYLKFHTWYYLCVQKVNRISSVVALFFLLDLLIVMIIEIKFQELKTQETNSADPLFVPENIKSLRNRNLSFIVKMSNQNFL